MYALFSSSLFPHKALYLVTQVSILFVCLFFNSNSKTLTILMMNRWLCLHVSINLTILLLSIRQEFTTPEVSLVGTRSVTHPRELLVRFSCIQVAVLSIILLLLHFFNSKGKMGRYGTIAKYYILRDTTRACMHNHYFLSLEVNVLVS